jgi:hypothetical protein
MFQDWNFNVLSIIKINLMKKLILSMSVIGFFLLSACSNDDKTSNSTETTTDNVANPPVNVNTDAAPQEIGTPPAEPMQIQTVNPPAPTTTAVGMNPPHGQPGHDCDIAVGAPLNSPKNKNTSQPPTVIQVDPNSSSQEITIPATNPGQPQVIQTPPPTGPTPPGMNPPHGQPGHDCAIPVGAPLKK